MDERGGSGVRAAIGLEVHAQLLTRTKLFCACSAAYGDEPNSHMCPACLGLPGALPAPGTAAVEMAVRIALALGFTVNARSQFARKHYFYPDLPKGYQITQAERPLAEGGALRLDGPDGSKPVSLTRLHLEEDAGKSFHDASGGATLLDFNRAGVPLVEIVTAPDLESPEEASALLRRLRQILLCLRVCSGRMEEGALRCDANISLRGSDGAPGARVEVKNLNSFRFLERALHFEIRRQAEVLVSGGTVIRETRLFDEASGATAPMRLKEEGEDYRYFPEPDLPPLVLDAAFIESLRRSLPELPGPRRDRFVEDFGLAPGEAEVLVDDPELCAYFEEAAAASSRPKAVANWVLREVLTAAKSRPGGLSELASSVPPTRLAGLILGGENEGIPRAAAAQIFLRMCATGEAFGPAKAGAGITSAPSEGDLVGMVERAFAENPEAVDDYLAGKQKAFGFLVGAAMRLASGRADPAIVNRLVRARLATRQTESS